ncbi:hypothetical protein PGT21_021913 [Puccinia graminis f. sp. tritici]|uniref:Uncharacterized protein n=1 Tax=Puccinia graminis f. sp. tritici TaxID=56615 RepID=A0A5B0NJS0_PUCGR|nr:hypothetical protein PGT21_021913 [Puccinia graminis f. sp. tritici]
MSSAPGVFPSSANPSNCNHLSRSIQLQRFQADHICNLACKLDPLTKKKDQPLTNKHSRNALRTYSSPLDQNIYHPSLGVSCTNLAILCLAVEDTPCCFD